MNALLTGRAPRFVLALVVAISVHSASPSHARQTEPQGVLEGRVLDATSGRPIPGVELAFGETKAFTDGTGSFTLELASGASVRIFATGYYEERIVFDGVNPPGGLEILLVSSTGFTETIDVRAEGGQSLTPTEIDIQPQSVERVAGSLDNVFRTLQALPGVQATEDFSSRLSVRGGTPDQNLTIMDGVEIHNPYRLFGITSAFNPNAVESFELTAGGFSAKYGDRLSSLLVVENRAGKTRRQGAGSLSITDANVSYEGAIPGSSGGSFLVTGRRTYYDLVAERFVDNNLPSFADVQAKADWIFGAGHRLSVFALRSREDANFDISSNQAGDSGALLSDAGNDLFSTRLDLALNDRTTSRTIVSWFRNVDFVSFDGNFREEAKRSNVEDDDLAFGRVSIVFDRELAIRDRSLRQEFSWAPSRTHFLETGFEVHGLRSGVSFATVGDRNVQQANGSSVRGGSGLPDVLDSELIGVRGGAWVQDNLSLGENWKLQPGLRFDWSRASGASTVSPRLTLSYRPNPQTRLSAALGLYTQSPGYEKLLSSDFFIDLTDPSLELAYEKATHVILGWERELSLGLTARVEGYYKKFDDLIVGRLESPEELASRVARYDFPEEFASSVPSEPSITSFPQNDSAGRAYGLDFFVGRQAASGSERVTGWLSYTLGKAERESYGRSFPLEYDRRHALNLVAAFRLSKSWELAMTSRLASGFPTTPLEGLIVSATETQDGLLVPEFDGSGNPVYTISYGGIERLNTDRLPFYSRVDLRASYQRGGRDGRWELYFEVLNLLNRKNASFIETSLRYNPDSSLPRIEQQREGAFPLLPSFGFRLRF